MFIDKIPEQEWVEYICHQFAATGKSISQDLAALICKYAECQSSYVQHLSWIAWYKTEGQADKDTIDSALSDLLKQKYVFLSPMFSEILIAHNILRVLPPKQA